MKKNIILAILFVFLGTAFTNSVYSAPKKAKAAPAATAKATKGQVASLEKVLMGGDGLVKKEEAKKIADKGGVLVLKVATKYYFVINEDGSIASKKLAGFAENANLEVKGATKVVNGMNVIIATAFDAK